MRFTYGALGYQVERDNYHKKAREYYVEPEVADNGVESEALNCWTEYKQRATVFKDMADAQEVFEKFCTKSVFVSSPYITVR